jgi:hypothetical protein
MSSNWDGKSRPSNDTYRRNFDDIFKKEKEITNTPIKQPIAKRKSCPCGRSPIPRCIGWHALTRKDYEEKLKEWNEKHV